MRFRRLTSGDRDVARSVFRMMADVFAEVCHQLSDAYVDRLLGRDDFLTIAAFDGDGS